MKKSLIGLLIACSVVSVQSTLGVNANAIPYVATPAISTISMDDNETAPIPKLARFDQISPNQIEISYDRDVDIKLGTKTTNYWIQSTMDIKPKDIATLGKNDKVSSKNSLTSDKVKIEAKSGSAKTFVLTFNHPITKGAQYKLIICYVTVEGAPAYNGDNGIIAFMGK